MALADSAAMAARPAPCFGSGPSSWERLSVASPVTGARGNKSAAVDLAGAPVAWHVPPMTPAFEPSAFGGETDSARLTVNLKVPPEQVDLLEGLDEWLMAYCVEHSPRLFGKPLTAEQLRGMYNGPIKRHEKYGMSLRCKLVLAGETVTRFWTPEGQLRDAPDSWKSCEIRSVLRIHSVWWVGREFGLTLQLTDCQVTERRVECPF